MNKKRKIKPSCCRCFLEGMKLKKEKVFKDRGIRGRPYFHEEKRLEKRKEVLKEDRGDQRETIVTKVRRLARDSWPLIFPVNEW